MDKVVGPPSFKNNSTKSHLWKWVSVAYAAEEISEIQREYKDFQVMLLFVDLIPVWFLPLWT